MSFPPEVTQMVVSYFIIPIHLSQFPAEWPAVSGLWSNFKICRDPVIFNSEDGIPNKTTFYKLTLDLPSLLSLRLVSRDWNMAATAVLKQHHSWRASLDSETSVKKALNATRSASAPNLPGFCPRNIVVPRIIHSWVPTREYQGLDPETEEPVYEEVPGLPWSLIPSTPDRFNKELIYQTFRDLFDNIQGVEALEASYPIARGAIERTELYGYFMSHDLEAVANTMSLVRYALQSTGLENLVDLCLDLPCTYHVKELAEVLDQNARDRLRHLYIGITDSTGQYGDNETVWDPEQEDSIPLENNDFMNSPLQDIYPNREHQGYLWEFVSSCPNLKSLGVSASHFLDLDYLRQKDQKILQWLECLYLSRVYVSISSLKSLIQGHSEQPRLRRIKLDDVKIHVDGGDWHEFISYLMNDCPDLDFAQLYQLTYFRAHPKYLYNDRPRENRNYVWSRATKDIKYLFKLLRQLRFKSSCPDLFPVKFPPYPIDEEELALQHDSDLEW